MKNIFFALMFLTLSCEAPQGQRTSDYNEFYADPVTITHETFSENEDVDIEVDPGLDAVTTEVSEYEGEAGYENCDFDYYSGTHNDSNTSWSGQIAMCQNSNNKNQVMFKTSKTFSNSEFCIIPLSSNSNGQVAVYGMRVPNGTTNGTIRYMIECSPHLQQGTAHHANFENDGFFLSRTHYPFNSVVVIHRSYAMAQLPNLFSCFHGDSAGCQMWMSQAAGYFKVIKFN